MGPWIIVVTHPFFASTTAWHNFVDLVQDYSNSIANALELL